MEEEKQKVIHLNADDEINFIIEKVKKCEEKEITLVIPENATILQNLMNLKVLRMNAKEFEKNISIVTIDDSEYFKTDNKTENQVNSIKDLIDESEEKLDEELSEREKNHGNVSKISSVKNPENKRPESKIKMRDIIKIKETGIGGSADGAIEEIKKEKEESLLQRNGFNPKENRNTEDSESASGKISDEADDSKESKKQSGKKTNLLPSLSSKFFIGFIIICLVTVAAILGFVLPKADIIITLKTEALTYNFEFAADELIDKFDPVSDKIPSEKIEIVNEESGDYPATGKKHITEKAVGKITIYNECSTGPQALVANTRFLSKEGKIFRIKEAVEIAGFTKPEDKIIPGSVVANVIAEEPGESYNIEGTSFTIPKLQELNSWKFSCLYARSEQAMSGGVDKEVLYFSDSDYLTAKEKLAKAAEEKNKKESSKKSSDEYVLLENLEQKEEVKIGGDIKIGDVVDNFQMTVSVKTTALFANKNDLENLINEKINSDLSGDRELVEGSMHYEVGEVSKNENGKISIPVFVSQSSIIKIDIDKIKSEIAGKNELELRKYFVNIKGIKATDVGFWPFWVKSIPSSPDKINVAVDINNSM